jgi:hypothetical protein
VCSSEPRQSLITVLYGFGFLAYSRTVFVIYALLLMIRGNTVASFVPAGRRFIQRQRRTGSRVVIYGAGDGGGMVIQPAAWRQSGCSHRRLRR